MSQEPVLAQVTVVRNSRELKAAILAIAPGTVLNIAPGEYLGGNFIQNVEDLTIQALDPANPPHFKGGKTAWHFSKCTGLTLRHLRISGQSDNGINLDDGGEREHPVEGIRISDLDISDIGPTGNHDAIKGSGLRDLVVRDCKFSGWGGQGIDLVGCHQSVISHCQFVGKEGFSASAGVQLKGGSSEITVENCDFVRAGERPINIGGSTGLPYFRPVEANHEANRIIVRNNTIQGSSCAAAFVGVDGAEFSDNTIIYPEKWIFRILQETKDQRFVSCRNVLVKNNRIIFQRSQVGIEINIGDGTEPQSFRFEGNHWFAEDRPERSRPKLPVEEIGGNYGTDPRLLPR